MTLNVRQPDLDDGLNCWENRRDLLVETVLTAQPDLIGTQELFTIQADFILDRAPDYACFGAGRFGDKRDKHVGIFYRKDRLVPLESGDFWLSETPEVAGSASWEIIRPRQVTWAEFQTRRGVRFHHFNTHFPYRPMEEEARRKTAELLLSRTAVLERIMLTADFNSPADGEIYQLLATQFEDAWRTAQTRCGPEGTLNAFGRHEGSRRIDWILYRANWRVLEAATIVTHRDGVYASDHYPVMARFEL